MYLIVSVDCIGFLSILFLLFYIQLFSYFCCKHVNKRSVFRMPSCFDTVGWVTERASSLLKLEYWFVGASDVTGALQ